MTIAVEGQVVWYSTVPNSAVPARIIAVHPPASALGVTRVDLEVPKFNSSEVLIQEGVPYWDGEGARPGPPTAEEFP
jgi:hypothetical protein